MNYALIGCGRIAVNHIKAVVNNGLEMIAGNFGGAYDFFIPDSK